MAEEPIVVEEKVTEPQGTPPEESEEVKQLNAQKAELEKEIAGLEGTRKSITEDIVRKRSERKETQPEIDEEAREEALLEKLMPKVEEKLEERLGERLKPLNDENLLLKQQLAQQQEETIKAKKAQIESINARVASTTAAHSSAIPDSAPKDNVELSDKEAKIAKELGLKNPRYMKDVEVL